ncbi:MAG TPA: AAA domain-containing protein [Thermoanaerobaculia bacterium]|nr:AAA domain-containing protein [Thermoanaerobaculia bacterium]
MLRTRHYQSFACRGRSDREDPTVSGAGSPEAHGIFDAWTALEVLSPQSFKRPEDLANGERSRIASLENQTLPWEGGGEKSRPKYKLFYQLVLGTIQLAPAAERLLATFGDARPERYRTLGEAPLALLVLSQDGRLARSPAVSISSFAWGLKHALGEDLAALSAWPAQERILIQELDELLRRHGSEETDPILDRTRVDAAFRWLLRRLAVPREMVKEPRFAVRSYEYYTNPDPPEPLLLNSFFLRDLRAAKELFVSRKAPCNLRQYLGLEPPRDRKDLLCDFEALAEAVAPERMPRGRWPSRGRYPLVLLQQAAVNLSFDLRDRSGVVAVNGPPGTGKTTLLRDLMAAIVTARAEAMMAFDDPATAFSHAGEKLKAGTTWLHLYRLDLRLRGFEILVASSNNKAVENVSAALPALEAIAEDATDLRYFSTLSDVLFDRETWGLGAAVLGNATNRGRFSKLFWWDKEVGLSTYLAEAAGTPQLVETKDLKTGEIRTHRPRIVVEERPPQNHDGALRRWKKARTLFREALKRSSQCLESLSEARRRAKELPELEAALQKAEDTAKGAEALLDSERRTWQAAQDQAIMARAELAAIEQSLHVIDRAAPGLLAQLLRTRRTKEWRAARAPVALSLERARGATLEVEGLVAGLEVEVREAESANCRAEAELRLAAERVNSCRDAVEEVRTRLGHQFVDAMTMDLDHTARHLLVPWLDAEHQRLRDAVFIQAMDLHGAFIDAAARPLRHNLSVLMSVLGGRKLPTVEKRALVSDLWTSLFLVVPLVSTTFASVERMLDDLPPESLGWLFIDEAGQGLPQAAVGALMRTRRAVIVGDPVQIEPIVALPSSLTQAICRHFLVDPDRFNAPEASVQTLADTATPYMAEFEGRSGSRTVGVPLLVHRRCSEPMFGISNAVAYERLMVQAKIQGSSKIGEVLGPSSWTDVKSSGVDKWSPEEGDEAIKLLRRLAQAGVQPDLYIITPFVTVAENLRSLLRRTELPEGWLEDPAGWSAERVGTVHTAQGREAEAVIFVLGAPETHQTGARNWAGSRPNLLNVAVTRAKEQLYVIGNRMLWREAGVFRDLDERLP